MLSRWMKSQSSVSEILWKLLMQPPLQQILQVIYHIVVAGIDVTPQKHEYAQKSMHKLSFYLTVVKIIIYLVIFYPIL